MPGVVPRCMGSGCPRNCGLNRTTWTISYGSPLLGEYGLALPYLFPLFVTFVSIALAVSPWCLLMTVLPSFQEPKAPFFVNRDDADEAEVSSRPTQSRSLNFWPSLGEFDWRIVEDGTPPPQQRWVTKILEGCPVPLRRSPEVSVERRGDCVWKDWTALSLGMGPLSLDFRGAGDLEGCWRAYLSAGICPEGC